MASVNSIDGEYTTRRDEQNAQRNRNRKENNRNAASKHNHEIDRFESQSSDKNRKIN